MSDFFGHSFDVTLPTAAFKGRVEMDGVELKGVTSVKVEADVGSLTTVSLSFVPREVLLHLNEPVVIAKIAELTEPQQDVTAMGDLKRKYAYGPQKATTE